MKWTPRDPLQEQITLDFVFLWMPFATLHLSMLCQWVYWLWPW